MQDKLTLMIPGPTPVPERVLKARAGSLGQATCSAERLQTVVAPEP